MTEPNFRALCSKLVDLLNNIHSLVWVEAPRLLDEDRGGDSRLDIDIEEAIEKVRTALAAPAIELMPEQTDLTLRSIRENTPRYRISVIVSTHDTAIDTRMPIIWSALDPNKEILESVSLPEQLPPLGNP